LTGVEDHAVILELSEPAPSRTVTLEYQVIAEAKRAVTW
jgi:hypothetical protein